MLLSWDSFLEMQFHSFPDVKLDDRRIVLLDFVSGSMVPHKLPSSAETASKNSMDPHARIGFVHR